MTIKIFKIAFNVTFWALITLKVAAYVIGNV